MATLASLLDGIEAATATISPATLGLGGSMQFLGDDAITVPAGGFTAVYAFGDSLSDAGNDSLATAGVIPVSPPYSDGRFTNGNVWVQDLSQQLGLPPVKASLAGGTDYAYGGAETGNTPIHTVNPTDLPSQLGQFVLNTPSPSPNALYTVWIGSNDVLDIANHVTDPTQQQADISAAVQNEDTFLSGLIAAGAKNIMVLNVPDLGVIPYETERGSAISATASTLSADYDNELANSLQAIAASGAAKLDLLNTYALLDQLVASPGSYGFTNASSPVWTGNLTSSSSGVLQATGSAQNGYVFFDAMHPTAQAHTLLADAAMQELTGVA
ncbi:MAG TPA: SGNH/GDSL hydrolase family protein [Acetobacteraceae bacterium]|jgi:phospholipase/lecithinase/hemolysin|nr:SGNH/GDSL hydrolase family protein [Acetobacteraceae bacterium]